MQNPPQVNLSPPRSPAAGSGRIKIDWKAMFVDSPSRDREADVCFASPSSAPRAPAAAETRARAFGVAEALSGDRHRRRRGSPDGHQRKRFGKLRNDVDWCVAERRTAAHGGDGARRPVTRAAVKAADGRGQDAHSVYDFGSLEDMLAERIANRLCSRLPPEMTASQEVVATMAPGTSPSVPIMIAEEDEAVEVERAEWALRTADVAGTSGASPRHEGWSIPRAVTSEADGQARVSVVPNIRSSTALARERDLLALVPVERASVAQTVSRLQGREEEREAAARRRVVSGMQSAMEQIESLKKTLKEVSAGAKEINELSHGKSVFLHRESGVWDAAREAQQEKPELEEALRHSQVEINTACIATERANQWAHVATAGMKRARERDETRREVHQVVHSREQAFERIESEKTMRRQAEETRDRLAKEIEQLEGEKMEARGAASHSVRLLEEVDSKILALEASLKSEQEQSAEHASAVERLVTQVSGYRQQLEELKRNIGDAGSWYDVLAGSVEAGLGELQVDSSLPLPDPVSSIPDRAQELVQIGFHRGVLKTLAVFRSHYDGLDYETVCKGWAPGPSSERLAAILEEMTPSAHALAAILGEEEATESDIEVPDAMRQE